MPLEAGAHVSDANDCPRAFHSILVALDAPPSNAQPRVSYSLDASFQAIALRQLPATTRARSAPRRSEPEQYSCRDCDRRGECKNRQVKRQIEADRAARPGGHNVHQHSTAPYGKRHAYRCTQKCKQQAFCEQLSNQLRGTL